MIIGDLKEIEDVKTLLQKTHIRTLRPRMLSPIDKTLHGSYISSMSRYYKYFFSLKYRTGLENYLCLKTKFIVSNEFNAAFPNE